MKATSRNRPIATVIKNYVDKKSGKVSDSRNEIKRRFYGLDWKDQKKIMAAFLDACQSDREWAYLRLLDLWDASFEQIISELWDQYHEERCAWVIIRYFPKAYLKEHIDQFREGRDYYFICRRFADDKDFVIDKERLSRKDYIMAMYRADRHVDDAEAADCLYETARDISFKWLPLTELSRNYSPKRNEMMAVSDFSNVAIVLYYLRKMGNDEVVAEFRDWESDVQMAVRKSEEYVRLTQMPLTDFEYKDKLSEIVHKYIFYCLPDKYKTMTDEEYDKRSIVSGSPIRMFENTPSLEDMGFESFLEYNQEDDKPF